MLGVINTLVTSGFTLALALTVAARALLLTSLNPLWTALIGWLVLKDRLPRRTIAAVGVAAARARSETKFARRAPQLTGSAGAAEPTLLNKVGLLRRAGRLRLQMSRIAGCSHSRKAVA